MAPDQEPVTPEALAADFDRIASWMATRPSGVTWTGDGMDGTVAGLRDAAKSIREHVVPAWDALTAERDRARAELATCRGHNAAIAVQLDQYRDERDQAREQLSEIQAMVRAAPALASAEQLGIVLRAIHEAAALEQRP